MKVGGVYFNPRNIEAVQRISKIEVFDKDAKEADYKKTIDYEGWKVSLVSGSYWHVPFSEENQKDMNDLVNAFNR